MSPIAPETAEAARPISAGVSSVVTSQAVVARAAKMSQLAATDAVPPLMAFRVSRWPWRSCMRVRLPGNARYTQAVSAQKDMLTTAEVRRLAELCRLSPSEAQVESLKHDLSAVLGHAACLAQAPLDGVEPMARPVDEVNRLDDDVPGATLDRSAIEGMAPAFDGVYFQVPRVIDGGSSSGGDA